MRAQILFNNDAPLCALFNPTAEQMARVKVQYMNEEQARARQHCGTDRDARDLNSWQSYMERCYFHYHEVPISALTADTCPHGHSSPVRCAECVPPQFREEYCRLLKEGRT